MADLQKLENFYKYLIPSNGEKIKVPPKNYLMIQQMAKNYFDQFNKFSYFNFIMKDNTKESSAKLNLAIDFKCMMKYYQLQSCLVGVNVLYLMLLIPQRKNIFSFYSIISYLSALGITFWYQYYYSTRIFSAMDLIFKKDIEFLYKKMKKEESGFTEKVTSIDKINNYIIDVKKLSEC